jgi:putative Mg2+ transporter-C (MgtC) family protein
MVPELSTLDLIVRILVSGLLGGLIGLERELADQPAGLRTNILVSIGATLFTLIGSYGVAPFFEGEGSVQVTFDPTRVAAQIVSGIGFLGAGAILREGVNIKGLTTAAALWVSAAIGTAVGLGYWPAAIVTVVVTVLTLGLLKSLAYRAFPRLRERDPEPGDESQ